MDKNDKKLDREKVENENRRILYGILSNSFDNEKLFCKQMRLHNAYIRFDQIIVLMNKAIIIDGATYANVIENRIIGQLIMDLMYYLHEGVDKKRTDKPNEI
ncbi:hypothetical protein [Lactobacillus taiwanensis]|uniref:hypothetical protein n=1 Tax=Lactobacillus taiwanensis TaxID=508451 RepID=UPI00241FE7DF|nr:hypothetical protein [Lactobacillus taiwanensis]